MSVFGATTLKGQVWLLNVGGMLYFLILSFGSLAIGLLVTLPGVFRDNPGTLHQHKTFGVTIVALLQAHYVCLKYFSRSSKITSDSDSYLRLPQSGRQGLVQAEEEERQVCHSCGIIKPPRCKHCPLCDVCVLKRDHHCFFAGCCVGFFNQRYFISFCLYGWVGTLYSTYLTFTYLAHHYADILSSEFYAFLAPWVAWRWLMGQVTADIAAMVIFGYFNFLTLLGCLYYFSFQCFLLWNGQTSYEYVKGIRRYRYSLVSNIRSVFGPYWLLSILVPLPFLKSPDNGVDWKIVHDFKER